MTLYPVFSNSPHRRFSLKPLDQPRWFLVYIAVSTFSIMIDYPSSLISVTQVSAVDNSSISTSPFIIYNSTQYRFAIEYPENWKINERDSAIWFASPVDGSGNVGIQMQTAQNTSLQDLVKGQLDRYKQGFKDFHVISSNLTTLSGITANRTDYSFKSEEPKYLGTDLFGTNIENLLAIAISTIKNGNLYTVTYISTAENFDIFLPIVEEMLSTLKLL